MNSTINHDNVNSFDNSTTDESDTLDKTIYNIYKIRWNIEVIFYQQKTFWSFSNYMVRSKAGIEKYVNLQKIGNNHQRFLIQIILMTIIMI